MSLRQYARYVNEGRNRKLASLVRINIGGGLRENQKTICEEFSRDQGA